MNKDTVIDIIMQLGMDDNSYCLLAGGAMLFYGLRQETNDIDLSVTQETLEDLQGWFVVEELDEEKRHYAIGENIELYVVPQEELHPLLRENTYVQRPEDILALKKRLNREKDRNDIIALERYLAERNG